VESFIEFVGGLAFKQILGGSLGLISGIAFKSSHSLFLSRILQLNSSNSHPVLYLMFHLVSELIQVGVLELYHIPLLWFHPCQNFPSPCYENHGESSPLFSLNFLTKHLLKFTSLNPHSHSPQIPPLPSQRTPTK